MQLEAACGHGTGLPEDITMKTLFEAGDYPGKRPCLDKSNNL